jgi:hypothetical protein
MELSPTISATNTVQNDNSSTSSENDALSALLTWQSPPMLASVIGRT